MSQRHNTNRIRRQISYSIQEITEMLAVHKNTVRSWVREGLPKTDKQKPWLIHGQDLREFLSKRQSLRQKKCGLDEFYCFRCRMPRRPFGNLADVKVRNAKTVVVCGFCEVCDTSMNKVQSAKNLAKIFQTFDIPKQLQKHIYDSTTRSLNCDLRKE